MEQSETRPGADASEGGEQRVADRYALLERLDDFGLGEVWKARDTRFENRLVAVKLLRPVEGDGAELPEALAARFKSLRTLRHKLALPMVNFGLHGRRPFVVYEHFEGRSLGSLLDDARARGEPPPLGQLRAVIDGVLAAFAAMHGLAEPARHGALSPASVLVREGDGAEVRVIDFGLGPLADAPEVPRRSARAARCDSPEQLAGAEATVASDVFSLGLLILEALADPPQENTSAALSLRYVGRADVPDAVWDALVLAMKQKPEERFPNAAVFRSTLNVAWETPDPVTTVPDPKAAVKGVAAPAPRPESFGAAVERRRNAPAPRPDGAPLPLPVEGPMPALAPAPSFSDDGDDDLATLQVARPEAPDALARTVALDDAPDDPRPSLELDGARTKILDRSERHVARMQLLSTVMTSYDRAVHEAAKEAPRRAVSALSWPGAQPPAPAPRPSRSSVTATALVLAAMVGLALVAWRLLHDRADHPPPPAATPSP